MKLKTILLTAISLFGFSVSAQALEIGGELPKVKGTNHHGKVVELKATDGNQWLLIFTYPKALTGG